MKTVTATFWRGSSTRREKQLCGATPSATGFIACPASRTSDLGPRTSDLGPRTSDLGLRTLDQSTAPTGFIASLVLRTSDLGPRTSDFRPQTSDFGPRTADLRLPCLVIHRKNFARVTTALATH